MEDIHEQIDVVEGEAEMFQMETNTELLDSAANFGAPVDLRSSYALMNTKKYHNNEDLLVIFFLYFLILKKFFFNFFIHL